MRNGLQWEEGECTQSRVLFRRSALLWGLSLLNTCWQLLSLCETSGSEGPRAHLLSPIHRPQPRASSRGPQQRCVSGSSSQEADETKHLWPHWAGIWHRAKDDSRDTCGYGYLRCEPVGRISDCQKKWSDMIKVQNNYPEFSAFGKTMQITIYSFRILSSSLKETLNIFCQSLPVLPLHFIHLLSTPGDLPVRIDFNCLQHPVPGLTKDAEQGPRVETEDNTW